MATKQGRYYYTKEETDEIVDEINGKLLDDFIYDTDEKACGKWIDDRTIYRKTIDLGSFPNASTKDVAHGVTDIDMIIKIEGFMTTGGRTLPLPQPGASVAETVRLYANRVNVTIDTRELDRTGWTGFATIYYVKVAAS